MTRASRRIARGIGPIAVAVAVQSAGNLGFHAVAGRLLGPADYGALGTVLAAMVLLAVPLGALQSAAAGTVAEHGLSRSTARRTLSRIAWWSALPALAVLACASGLREYFQLGSWTDAAQLGPYLMVSAVLAAARGMLLGGRRTGSVAVTYLVGTGVRLGLGLAFVVPFGMPGALLGTVAGEVAALAAAVARLFPHGRGLPAAVRELSSAGDGTVDRLRLRTVGRAGLAVSGLFLFSTADLFLARHHLPAGAAGSYVAAATVAKTVLALPAAIVSVVFPRLVAGWPGPGRGRILLASGMAVVGPALLGAVVVAAAPSLLLALLFGAGYAGAAGLVRTLSVVAALTSLVTLLTNAALARRARTVALPWVGAALEVLLIERWHGSAAEVAACSLAALLPTLLLLVAVEGRAWCRRTSQLGADTADRPGTAARRTTSTEVTPAAAPDADSEEPDRAHPGAELAGPGAPGRGRCGDLHRADPAPLGGRRA